MNKNFKVIFNKLRGSWMVVNELTSAVQAKGTKAVVVATTAVLTASVAVGVEAKPSTLVSTSNQSVTTSSDQWGGLADLNENTGTVTDIVYKDNSVNVSNIIFYGGIADLYGTKLTLTNSQFIGTKSVFTKLSSNASAHDAQVNGIAGGVFFVKNGTNKFVDVQFSNNTIANEAQGVGGFVAGGAIYQDAIMNEVDGVRPSALTIEISPNKDLTYSGNNVTTVTPDVYYGLYGTVSTSAGGFLFLDRESSTNFNIGAGATLHIGTAASSGNMDSIASAISIDPKKSAEQTGFEKTGAGTLEINSSLDKFYGFVHLKEGTLAVTKAWNVMGNVTVDAGSTLTTGDVTLTRSPTELTYNGTKYVEGDGKLQVTSGVLTTLGNVSIQKLTLATKQNSLTVNGGVTTVKDLAMDAGTVKVAGGMLDVTGTMTKKAGSLVVSNGVLKANALFKNMATDNVALSDVLVKTDLTGGTLDVVDFTGTYDLAYLQKLEALTGGSKVTLRNGSLVDAQATLDKVTEAGANAAGETVTANTSSTGKVEVSNANDATVGAVKVEGATAATGLELNAGAGKLTFAGTSDGTKGALIEGNVANDFTVDIKDGAELALGFDAQSAGTLDHQVNVASNGTLSTVGGNFDVKTVEVAGGGSVVVNNSATLNVDKLTGAGNVFVGNNETAGKMTVNSLEGMTGLIFVDPAWSDNHALNTVGNASHLAISNVGTTGLTAKIVAGQNSLVSFGATADQAAQAFEKIADAKGLAWKQDVTAAGYVDSTLDVTNGGVLIDGSLTAAPTTIENGVKVAANGMLIVKQPTANTAPINGTVTFVDGSYLGVSNASEGSWALADTVTGGDVVTVVTDNPFVVGQYDTVGNKVVTKVDATSGLNALSSAGIQAMTRRADFVMAQTIADRTSIDQEMQSGVNLWVDVTGERYDADDFGNGSGFRADAGYAAFGADLAVTQDFTVGGALQYGTGSLRADGGAVKNDITSVGLTAYASQRFGAAKIVGELAYLQAENELTGNQSAMSVDVDSSIYSAGLRAQYQLTAGNFQFVPSIGLRVSRLETDAMNIGTVRVDDQDQTLVQMPIALRINGFEQNVSGWSVAPSFRIAYVPTFGDKEIKVYGYEQDVIDTSPVQADFGIRALNGNMMINANMLLGGGEYGTSSIGGKVGLKYVF